MSAQPIDSTPAPSTAQSVPSTAQPVYSTAVSSPAVSSPAVSSPAQPVSSPGVAGRPRSLLRLEGLALAGLALAGWHALGGTWGVFAGLVLLPDLSMLGYLAGPRWGALGYNAGHSLVGPALLGGLAWWLGLGTPWLLAALLWTAHIGLDRALGYGLKYRSGFFDTHLGRVSPPRALEAREERGAVEAAA